MMTHSELIRRLAPVFGGFRHVRFCPLLSCERSSRSFSDEAPGIRPLASSLEYQELRNKIQSVGFGITSTPILSPLTVQAVRDRFEPLFRGEFETKIYPDEWHWRKGISLSHGVTREICNAYKADRTIARVILSPTLAAMVAKVMGWSSVRIAQDDILWKPPNVMTLTTTKNDSHCEEANMNAAYSGSTSTSFNATTVGFHQDSAYISTQFEPYENNSVTVWIALDDATKETGCLEYAPGSHLWRPLQHSRLEPNNGEDDKDSTRSLSNKEKSCDFQTKGRKDRDEEASFHSSNADTYQASLPQHSNNENGNDGNAHKIIVAAECMTGHAIFHHQDIWHGSGPNQSPTRHRRSLVGHYLRGDVQWKTHGSADHVTPWGSTSYIYGRYRTQGAVDVDESFFPILHAEPKSELKRTAWVDRYIGTTCGNSTR